MQRSSVDLPEPEAPRIETTSPSRAVSEMPLRTLSAPKLLCRSLRLTAIGGATARAALIRHLPHGALNQQARGGGAASVGIQMP
jgi:hypothetical protein